MLNPEIKTVLGLLGLFGIFGFPDPPLTWMVPPFKSPDASIDAEASVTLPAELIETEPPLAPLELTLIDPITLTEFAELKVTTPPFVETGAAGACTTEVAFEET